MADVTIYLLRFCDELNESGMSGNDNEGGCHLPSILLSLQAFMNHESVRKQGVSLSSGWALAVCEPKKSDGFGAMLRMLGVIFLLKLLFKSS